MKVALVTGSRDWTDGKAIRSVLNAFGPDLLIHGDCPTGADQIADEWGRATGTFTMRFPAERSGSQWPAAGPVRNGDMVKVAATLAKYGNEVGVFAFPLPGSKGTPDCVGKAKRATLTVAEFKGWKR